jgi:hypothetical protein
MPIETSTSSQEIVTELEESDEEAGLVKFGAWQRENGVIDA